MAKVSESKAKLTKEERYQSEDSKIRAIYEDIPDDQKAFVYGLIARLAFMKVEAEDLEEDLNENGWTEVFCQGSGPEYMRERPESRVYHTLIKNYQGVIRQLITFLPEQEDVDAATEMLEFVQKGKR